MSGIEFFCSNGSPPVNSTSGSFWFFLTEWLRQPSHIRLNLLKAAFLSFSEGIGCVAIRASQIAGRQPDEDARQSRKRAFALQAQVNLVDDYCVRHQRECTGTWRNGKPVQEVAPFCGKFNRAS